MSNQMNLDTNKVYQSLGQANIDGTYWYTQKELVELTGLTGASVSRHFTRIQDKYPDLVVRDAKLVRNTPIATYALKALADATATEAAIEYSQCIKELDAIKALMLRMRGNTEGVREVKEQLKAITKTMYLLK
jgi:hypothetical protein